MDVPNYEQERGPDITQGDLMLTDLRHSIVGRRWMKRLPEGSTMRHEDGVVCGASRFGSFTS